MTFANRRNNITVLGDLIKEKVIRWKCGVSGGGWN